MVDWQFTATIPPDRAVKLRDWVRFDDILASLLRAPVERFWWEPFRSPRLTGCNRASFTLKVSPADYDAFFNSPKGYRAQYASSPSVGEAANRTLLNVLEPALMASTLPQTDVEAELILASLRAVDAKIWIVEAEVDDQLSDPNPAIAYEPWHFESPNGQGLRAPVGTLLEVKGGWLDSHGNERRDPLKSSRSSHIFRTGFS